MKVIRLKLMIKTSVRWRVPSKSRWVHIIRQEIAYIRLCFLNQVIRIWRRSQNQIWNQIEVFVKKFKLRRSMFKFLMRVDLWLLKKQVKAHQQRSFTQECRIIQTIRVKDSKYRQKVILVREVFQKTYWVQPIETYPANLFNKLIWNSVFGQICHMKNKLN